MTSLLIITVCSLLLLAYAFDLTASRTRIPSVILLLLLGWSLHRIIDLAGVERIPNLAPLLPIFGTVGLILIVLEGALELELDRSKGRLIGKSSLVAILPMIVLAFGLAYALQRAGGGPFRIALINAIPLCVISSAIAIPSAGSMSHGNKEFIIYESSLSDIFGVLLFNFVAMNETYGWESIGHFGLEMLLIAIVSLIASAGLALLLRRIDHPIKFTPIILMVILIYALAKVYHLPALLFILAFGLAIGNLDALKSWRWVRWLQPDRLEAEVAKFRSLTVEITFLIRALFFLLFGYLIQNEELLNLGTLGWAGGIVAGIFLLRALTLMVTRLPVFPLLFVAPRGLITILLFLSIGVDQRMELMSRPLIIQVIILTACALMMGNMLTKRGARRKAADAAISPAESMPA